MDHQFDIGDWVIDTKRNTAPTVIAVIPGSKSVYVLEYEGDLYLETDENLIPYDKRYFGKAPVEEISVEEMRRTLSNHCDTVGSCENCPFFLREWSCYFSKDESTHMTDDEIREAYNYWLNRK